jgi:acyl-CoA dehydrogenase
MRATVHAGRSDFERHQDDPEVLAGLGFAIRMNNLKVSAARMAPEIVTHALGVCGVSGFCWVFFFCVGGFLGVGFCGVLMISNDRVLSANAAMLLLSKEE